jgi:radical SAM protein with 4Fe4S-binding SPASM domain
MFVSYADAAHLASKITGKRLSNMYHIWRSFHRSRNLGRPEIQGLPWSISVEPTTACNLRCPECPSGLRAFTRPTGKMDRPVFEALVDELHPTLWYLIFYFQGEPYLHHDFLPMVAYASQHGIYTATSTNAHFLTKKKAEETVKSGLSRMIISIDGSDQQTYEAYRKTGDINKVLEGTRHMIEARKRLRSKTPAIIWQFLVVRPNEHQIEDIKRMGKEYGVDKVAFKTAQIYDYENGNPLIPTLEKYSRYRRNADGSYTIKGRIRNECWKMWHSCVITWDGQVVPCCFDKDAEHPMGNVGESPFREIWNSAAYDQFRQHLLRSRKDIDMCTNCTEGSRVWG